MIQKAFRGLMIIKGLILYIYFILFLLQSYEITSVNKCKVKYENDFEQTTCTI